MAFFNELGKRLGGVAEAAADKAKTLAEIAKLNSDISAEERQIESLYLEIGELVFASEKDNTNSPVVEQCQEILICQKNIAALSARIEQVKAGDEQVLGKKTEPIYPMHPNEDNSHARGELCSNCGVPVPENSKFCPSCGEPVND